MIIIKKGKIYTKASNNYQHYGERVIREKNYFLREWSPKKSKIAAAIKKGYKLNLSKKDEVLYIGCSSGTSLSHISDLCKIVYAIDISAISLLEMLSLLMNRSNIKAFLKDYRDLSFKKKFDYIFQDVSQKDQVDVFIDIVKKFLKDNGRAAISIKTSSIDSSKKSKEVLKEAIKKLEKNFKINYIIDLEPYEKKHYFIEISIKK